MRILIYAPVDLNVIDGSAVWCVSVAQMLALDPRITVDILLERRLARDVNVRGLEAGGRIGLLDPQTAERAEPAAAVRDGDPGPRLGAERAFAAIESLVGEGRYELVLVRGSDICRAVAAAPHLAARSWLYLTQHAETAETLEAVAGSNARIVCQTPLLQEHFEWTLGTAPGRFIPLPPMVPVEPAERARDAPRHRRACYVGKFDPDYRIEEMLAAFERVRAALPDVELAIAGDKFHDPADGRAFRRRVTARLESQAGVAWRGGLTRSEVSALIASSDVGCCWRTARYDDSLEMSTKALEYAAAGIPVLLNPSRVNRWAFGDDYPLYVETASSFADQLRRALEPSADYGRAARAALEAARRFTMSAVHERLAPYLNEFRPRGARPVRRGGARRVLIAGHDLKFATDLAEHLSGRSDCIVRIDRWTAHAQHDPRASAALLQWADVIWCEWCAGNAVWYSRRVRPSQTLVIRLHRYEITTEAPQQVIWENVRQLIFIAPHVRDALIGRLGQRVASRARLIENVVDCARFDRAKSPAAERTLGLLGYVPRLKNPRLAAEILLLLRERDPRWRLRIAGRSPESYPWIWADARERAYYESFERFVRQNGLEESILRSDWTDDPAAWFADVGFILSCSDLEGSHQAVAEGMASRAVPIVRRWNGAADVYPNAQLFETADEAARLILRAAEPARRAELAEQARAEALRRFDRGVILEQIERVLFDEAAAQPMAASAAAAPA